MSVKKIIQESIDKNPLGVKEALEEALQDRVRAALEEKYAEMMESKDEDEDDEDEDEDEDEDMDESFDLSDYTIEELEDFMMSEDFDQLDEISKKTLGSYVKKATSQATKDWNTYGAQRRKSGSLASKAHARGIKTGAGMEYDKEAGDAMDKADAAMKRYDKRATGIGRAKDRLTK